ncbi:MAG: pyridoxamine 5'-phosphate oxidase family protein, partial [Huintestinicola sp.]
CRWEEKGIERLQGLGEEHKKQHKDFEENISGLWKSIGSHGVMTLSTCARGRVSSRPMSVVVIDGKFYCQTDVNYLKCSQIRENPNVALCVKNYSVEGKCKILEEPVKYDFFMRAMKQHFPSAAERYSSLPLERVLEITPALIYLWDYHLSKPYMEFFEFRNNTYRKEWK